MVMKVSVRPMRSRADELMISPFRRIEVGAMVGARGAIMMVWSEVIQLAKSDVRARRGVQRPTVLRCWAHDNLFKMRVLRRGGPCSTRTASPAACRLPPRPARVAVGPLVPVGLSVSRPAVPVHAGAGVCCCLYCTPRSSNLQGSRANRSAGRAFQNRSAPCPLLAPSGSSPRPRALRFFERFFRRRRDPVRRLGTAAARRAGRAAAGG